MTFVDGEIHGNICEILFLMMLQSVIALTLSSCKQYPLPFFFQAQPGMMSRVCLAFLRCSPQQPARDLAMSGQALVFCLKEKATGVSEFFYFVYSVTALTPWTFSVLRAPASSSIDVNDDGVRAGFNCSVGTPLPSDAIYGK